jgi:hypothetical protein
VVPGGRSEGQGVCLEEVWQAWVLVVWAQG